MDAVPLPAERPAWFVEAGASSREARAGGVGLRLAWPWLAARLDPRVEAGWELALHRWSVPAAGGRRAVGQLVASPVLRWRPGGGGWFVEAGIGLSWHDGAYVRLPAGEVSRWNFQDTLAVGWGLAPGRALSLRWSHVSNAGLRRPNPGDDRLSLRWTAAF